MTAAPRSYADPCGIARALDVVGERWALLIVRELLFGPRRFTDLRDGLVGASPNVLSQRLRELVASGVVQRTAGGAAAYELTDWGRELHPILLTLGHWGARSGVPPRGALSVDALMAALESTFVASAAASLRGTLRLDLGEARFTVELAGGTLAIARGTPPRADAELATDAATLRAVVFGDRELSDAPVALKGDLALARRFFRLFRRPTREGASSSPSTRPAQGAAPGLDGRVSGPTARGRRRTPAPPRRGSRRR